MSVKSSARAHILETAGRLFFHHGYQAVGIDTIIAEAEIAKATLYRHFPSKDALIAAYLEEINMQFWVWFDNAAAAYPDQPREQLLAVFRALQKLVSSPRCLGCPFLMAAGEFPSHDHPGHRVALEHKQKLRERLRAMVAAAGLREPELLADHLYLLMDGAFVAVRMFGADNPAGRVALHAEHLIHCFE